MDMTPPYTHGGMYIVFWDANQGYCGRSFFFGIDRLKITCMLLGHESVREADPACAVAGAM